MPTYSANEIRTFLFRYMHFNSQYYTLMYSIVFGTALENSYVVAAIQQPFCLFSDCYLPANYPPFSQLLEVFYQMSFAVVGFPA